MQSKPKANSVVTTGYADGQFWWNVAGVGKLTLDESSLSKAVAHRAFVEGLSDRVVDKAALSRDATTGKPATPQAKYDAMKGLVEHYASGTESWAMASGAGFDNSATVLAAIARVKAYSVEMAEAFVTKFAAAQHGGDVKAALKYLATGRAVSLAMLEIRQERLGAAAIDADAALIEIPDAE